MRFLIVVAVLLVGSVQAKEIPEEPVLIEVDLTFVNGSDLQCLFRGEVLIDQESVEVRGCPSGQIVCADLIFADINTFAPFVRAEGCFSPLVSRSGFESD